MTKPYRQAVMGIILKPDGSYLIGSSPRDGGYKFPQGGLDEGETHLAGLIRELKEELDLDITASDIVLKLPQSVKYPYPQEKPYFKKYSGQELHVFILKYRPELLPIPQDNEFDEMLWIKPNEMDQFDFCHRKDAYYEALHNLLKHLDKKNPTE